MKLDNLDVLMTSDASIIEESLNAISNIIKKDIQVAMSDSTKKEFTEDNLAQGTALAVGKISKNKFIVYIGRQSDFIEEFGEIPIESRYFHATDAKDFVQAASASIENLSTLELTEVHRMHHLLKKIKEKLNITSQAIYETASLSQFKNGDLIFLTYQGDLVSFGRIVEEKYISILGDGSLHNLPVNVLPAFELGKCINHKFELESEYFPLRDQCCEHHKTMQGNTSLFGFLLNEATNNLDEGADPFTSILDILVSNLSVTNAIINNHNLSKVRINDQIH